jgi:glycosyltransferase involved in cell wall biosynthesis
MITVLMAVYNGEKYIREQIDSILSQTHPDFTLYIQDDCSTDSSYEIINEYVKRGGGRITARRLEHNTGNAKHNFYEMMARTRDDYIMLCDQDDVWLPDKIEKTLAAMKRLESEHGAQTPLLVHTDLTVVDEKLNVINPSFRKAMNADYNRTALNDLIIQNTLTGCTCMYNRALAALINDTPPEYMVMHDWWLILIAGAFGHVGHVDAPTILYRQHGGNEIGAKDVRTLRYKLDRLLHGGQVREAIDVTYKQAESFLGAYRDKLSEAHKLLLTEYVKIPGKAKLFKWLTVIKLRTFKNGFSRNIAYFLFI